MTNIFSHNISVSPSRCDRPEWKITKLEKDAILPSRANPSDAGYDLYALEETVIPARGRALVRTGIAMAIPCDHVGLIWPRSGTAVKCGIDVLAGVVDSGYRGEVCIVLQNHSEHDYVVRAGDRAAQMLIQEVSPVKMNVVDSLDSSDRGDGGFGSSGK